MHALTVFLLLALAGCDFKHENIYRSKGKLKVISFGYVIDSNIVEQFNSDSESKFTLTHLDNLKEFNAMLYSKKSKYDVVIAPRNTIGDLTTTGITKRGDNGYGVTIDWGFYHLAYNSYSIKEAETKGKENWSLLFNARKDCKIALPDNPHVVSSLVLLHLGKDINKFTLEQLQEANAVLASIKNNVVLYDDIFDIQNIKDICFALIKNTVYDTWSKFEFENELFNFNPIYPDQGMIKWQYNAALGIDAENSKDAMHFIHFLSQRNTQEKDSLVLIIANSPPIQYLKELDMYWALMKDGEL